MMTVGLGPSILSVPESGKHQHRLGYGYLARLGFGLTPDFIVFLGIDGTGLSDPDYTLAQTNYLIGVQYFVLPRLFVRGALGIAGISEDTEDGSSGAAGQSFLGGIGVELIQGDSVSFSAEIFSSIARFKSGTYFSNALGFTLSFF